MLSPDVARIRSFDVVPKLPEPLQPLLTIAYNLWWTWHPEAIDLFRQLDARQWHECHHNPVKLLGTISQQALDTAAADADYLRLLERVEQSLRQHMEQPSWFESVEQGDAGQRTIAYFCAEYGLTECLQVYSGGLGVLAGDHLKSASELGLPFVAVGLLYRHGYFQQYLNADGWQQEYYPDLDLENLPVRPVLSEAGDPVVVRIQLLGRDVQVAVWRADVGRVPLYLLDTHLPANRSEDRGITGQLYGGDMEMRIKQEIVLGIGGVRALEAVGIQPDVCHMNEGHSAFLALERIRKLIERYNITFDQARQQASSSHVFTTHTPVPAGIDRFPPDMIRRYFKDYHVSLRLDEEGLLALGRENVFDKREFFSMAVLALRTSDWTNGVSQLHGRISRHMWRGIWPGVPEEEVPIRHVTNGCHARTWMSVELTELFDQYGGDQWNDDPTNHKVWQAIHRVPDEDLWRLHERRRQRMIEWARRHLMWQLRHSGVSSDVIRHRCESMDPKAMTIGFARRFATYKRGTLFMQDAERLLRLLKNEHRPIQFLIAGKSHPADSGGKDLIRQIVRFARDSDVSSKIVFLENYDIHVARYLVQGCDVWLNTPRRGMEASGTSGMKAAINGGLNCSIMDGWWDEAAEVGDNDDAIGLSGSDIGWSIGCGEEYADPDTADRVESEALYDLLEHEIVPLFYERDGQGVPRRWVARMKQSIADLAPRFNSNRMIEEYSEKLYRPALRRAKQLAASDLKPAIELAHQKDRLRRHWNSLRIQEVTADTDQPLSVREALRVAVVVHLDELKPDEVRIQVYSGRLDSDGRLVQGEPQDLQFTESLDDHRHRFEGHVRPDTTGRYGFAIRIIPGGVMLQDIVEPGLILWEDGAAAVPVREARPAGAMS